MKTKDYTTCFTVDQSPKEVFEAINKVRGWWSEQIDGSTDTLGAEFKFHHKLSSSRSRGAGLRTITPTRKRSTSSSMGADRWKCTRSPRSFLSFTT
jgi:hypothetical protein